MKLVLVILSRGRSLKLDIQPIWVSRDNPFLLKADAISKGVDTDNWEIAISDFDHLSTLMGPFSVDLFATKDNAKKARFYSRTFEGGSLGVDAFAHSWSCECVFAAPPVSLVMRTIHKAASAMGMTGILIMRTIHKAASAMGMTGILIIPLWKNAKFWTLAFRDGTHLNQMFESVQIVRLHTFACEFARKDVIGGKEIQFLVLKFGHV
jgi:hypothetical protein